MKATRLAPLTTGSTSKLGTIKLLRTLTTRAPGASAATSWLVDRFRTFAKVKFLALPLKRIRPIDQNLILPLGRLASVSGTLLQGAAKKYDFASCLFFLGDSHSSRTESIHNFSKAVGAAVIAKLYFVAGLQCPFCERLCEIACANGSNFHNHFFPPTCCLLQEILYFVVQIFRNL